MEVSRSFWAVVLIIVYLGCTHDPIFLEEMDPDGIDTTDVNPPDTSDHIPVDSTLLADPCDDETVYFSRDVLPILVSSCALSGCHDSQTAKEEIVLESYASLIASDIVEPGNLDESDLYEVLTEDDPDKVMPRPPAERLSMEKIDLIAQWISQGALDLDCDDNTEGCDVSDVSFSSFVSPLIDLQCLGCHSGGSPSGGIALVGYENIRRVAQNGQLLGAISWSPGYAPMPRNLPQLTDCTIDKVKSWIDNGAENN